MQEARPIGVSPQVTGYVPVLDRWQLGITNRDIMATRHQVVTIECADPFYVHRDREGATRVTTEIIPRPLINRVGTKSRPFRLLSGQEIQLSEDDLRVTGISKAYTPSLIAGYGAYYQIGQLVPGQPGALYDLIFVDDSDPLTYSLTLRKREDTRYQGFDYDLP